MSESDMSFREWSDFNTCLHSQKVCLSSGHRSTNQQKYFVAQACTVSFLSRTNSWRWSSSFLVVLSPVANSFLFSFFCSERLFVTLEAEIQQLKVGIAEIQLRPWKTINLYAPFCFWIVKYFSDITDPSFLCPFPFAPCCILNLRSTCNAWPVFSSHSISFNTLIGI